MISRLLFLLAAVALVAPAGAETPAKARQRDHQIEFAESLSIEDVQAELEFGRAVAARILARYPLADEPDLQRYLNLVGQALAQHGGRPEIGYRFALLRADHINAYAAPGGYVFLTRGALALMRDEAELAAVLAHEIAHIDQRHIVKALRIEAGDASLMSGLTHLLGGAGGAGRAAFEQAADQAVEILFRRGLDQAEEFEADAVGSQLLAHTGYDAGALVRYLARIGGAEAAKTAALSGTHPSFASRVAGLEGILARDGLTSPNPKTVKARFQRYVQQ